MAGSEGGNSFCQAAGFSRNIKTQPELVMFALRRLLEDASRLGIDGEVALYQSASGIVAAMPKCRACRRCTQAPQRYWFDQFSAQ